MDSNHKQSLSQKVLEWGKALGFDDIGIADAGSVGLKEHETHLNQWLAKDFHGTMSYMGAHGDKRSRPAELIPDTRSIISVRLNYLVPEANCEAMIASDRQAYVARYALGRDYHKVIRRRLVKLWSKISDYLQEHELGEFQGRVFTDSAPVLEKAIAQQAGLGWIGKNTLLLSRDAGSWFFLGEIYTDLVLEPSKPHDTQHCGSCTACMDVCPTDAFAGPYELDARKCISYLTIEHRGSIDPALRRGIGNRIFGCDDCQVFCPWTKFAKITTEDDFSPRHRLDKAALLELFAWDETAFLKNTEGSAIRRTGYQGWLRNIAIALGNALADEAVLAALRQKKNEETDPVVLEHLDWAISEQLEKAHQR